MKIPLPVACDPPDFLPVGVTLVFVEAQADWTDEEREAFTGLFDHFEVDEEKVLAVRIHQNWLSAKGRAMAHASLIAQIRNGNASGISEEQAEKDHAADEGDDDPYICAHFEYESGTFSLFWDGLGEFDGWEGDLPAGQVVGEA